MLALPALAENPSASQLLDDLGFPSDAAKRVLADEFVETKVESSNDTEITAAVAFLVRTSPKDLTSDIHDGLGLQVDPNTIAYGILTGDGSIEQFDGMKQDGDHAKQIEAFRNAKPGGDLNLSAQEIETFQALAKQNASDEEIVQAIKQLLLGRYRAYREKGLAGITPYARDGEVIDGGAHLEQASKAGAGRPEKSAPAFYKVLLDYPNSKPTGFEEHFSWASYTAHGDKVIILTHHFSVPEGDAFLVCQRQFYVTGSYNVEQAIAGLLPVSEGTMVIYFNRTSTEQVTGFGGSGKRSIGGKVLANQLEDLFEKVRTKVAENESE